MEEEERHLLRSRKVFARPEVGLGVSCLLGVALAWVLVV